MECPKCHFDHPLQTTECLRCGIIFEKYLEYALTHPVTPPAAAAPADAIMNDDDERKLECDARRELVNRAIALPAALLLGWVVARTMPLLAAMLQMWTHESGHALTAWLCGYPAVPTPWITFHTQTREPIMSVLLGGAIAFGGYVACRMQRRFWLAVAAVTLALLLAGNLRTPFAAARLITFGGEAGSFVVSTVLMATFYARPQSVVSRKHMRWVLLVIGAIAFMYAYSMWAGGFENIVQWLDGIDERGPTDLAKLTQLYGWTIGQMQVNFLKVARTCWFALSAMYVLGVLQAWSRIPATKARTEEHSESLAC